MESRRASTRGQRRHSQDGDDAEGDQHIAAASSGEEEAAAMARRQKKLKKPTATGKTRSARERAELAKTTRALKSRLELALFKVGRGWEGVRFERIEAAHSQNTASDTTSSSVDLGEDALDASHASSSSSSARKKQASVSVAAAGASNTSNANGSTANWLERSAGHQEQLHSSLNGQEDALLSPIKPLTGVASTTSAATPTPSTRQARSANTSSTLQMETHSQTESPSVIPSTRNMMSSASPMPSVAAAPPSRPATTRPSLTASTSSLDCNPRPASARPRSDSNITIPASGPLSAPPTTTTFSSPIASSANNEDEFATPATTSRGNKRQRRESHQPKSSSKRQHATIHEEGSPPPPPTSASSSTSSSAVLNAAHLGHKRKISQNTLWHQSRAILSGIGGASANPLSPASQPANSSNAFSAPHPSPQAYLNGQNTASLTSPVRLKPGQQRPYGTPQDSSSQQQGQMHSSPYGNMQQQSPQGYAIPTQGSSVSPAGSSSGGTVRAATSTVQTTPRRPSAQMMQTAPHTIASSHHSHHQYMPHHPSNLGLASSSGSSVGGVAQMQFNPNATVSTGMMQQLSQQGQLIQQPQQQQQQALYAFQSPQTGQQPDYGYVVYNQQPHILQTPQHAQPSSHMMQHPHTAPQLHHSQQSMLAVNGYGTEYAGSIANGMNVFSFGDPHQPHLSPSYPQQQQQQQIQQQTVYGSQMSPLNMSTGFRNQNNAPQAQAGASTQMGHTMSMQGLPSRQPPPQPTHLTMMRSQSAISHAPSDMSTFTSSQPPPLDPSLLNASSSNGGSQESSSVDTNYSTHQNAQAAQIVAAHMANGQHRQQHQQANTRPGTANGGGPERETAAELMLYLAASPSPQQPSKKVGNTALGGGDLSQVKGRKLFGNEDTSSQQQQRNAHAQQQQQQNQQQQQLQQQQQQAHRDSISNHSQTSTGSGMNGSEMSKSQSQMGTLQQQDQSNPFAVQHTYPGMHDQNTFAPTQQQQMYNSAGQPTDMHTATAAAHQLAQPFEYNPAAMQFDPYTMMTSQGVTLDQEFGSGW